MIKLHTLLLVAVLISGLPCYACADNRAINELIYDGLGIDTGQSEAEIIEIHGQPATRTSKPKGPDSIAEKTTVIELLYEGFSFTIHRKPNTGNQPRETVVLTQVFGPNIRINHGLQIGVKVAAIQGLNSLHKCNSSCLV